MWWTMRPGCDAEGGTSSDGGDAALLGANSADDEQHDDDRSCRDARAETLLTALLLLPQPWPRRPDRRRNIDSDSAMVIPIPWQ